MRIPPILSVMTFALATAASAQQVRIGARLGATWSSTLMKDVIVNPITVKAGIAPTLALTASIPSGKKYRIGLEAVFSTASVKAKESGTTTDLGSLRTAALMLAADGPLMVRDFYFRIGVGFLKYLPSDKTGIFLQGGSARITGNFTAEYRRILRPGWYGMGAIRYGLSSFTTKELQSRGFTRSQVVHRVGLELGVAKDF
ncbi:MAG: hypothetical protein ABI836_08285 [Gemmatimonadota bacterium]